MRIDEKRIQKCHSVQEKSNRSVCLVCLDGVMHTNTHQNPGMWRVRKYTETEVGKKTEDDVMLMILRGTDRCDWADSGAVCTSRDWSKSSTSVCRAGGCDRTTKSITLYLSDGTHNNIQVVSRA